MLIRETAQRVAAHWWVEARLFELTGAWSTEDGDPDVRRVLAVQSRHHGWRAARWAELVPVLHDLDPGALVPPAPDVALLDALGADDAPVVRLAGLTSVVLPALLERYEAHLASTTEVADAPVARALRLVLADAGDDRRAAEAVLHSSLGGDDEVTARAAAHRSMLQALLS